MVEYIVDVALIAIFVAVTFIYYKRGFAKTVLKAASLLLSVILTLAFADKATGWIFSNTKLFAGTERYIAKLIVSVVMFVLLYFVLKWLANVINRVFKLPVLKQANKLLGAILGACCAMVIVSVISVALQVSSHVVYNANYVSAIDNSNIVQLVLSNEKISENINIIK
ncbi:MAG: CvpA family protein [Clostridia bacterium]|nr:CvpA family protein [Clostridia bacterium]